MAYEFEYEGEVAITPAIAGDLWPQVVALCEDSEAAIYGEAIFCVSADFEANRDDSACDAIVSGLRVDGGAVSADLAAMFEAQLVKQNHDTLMEYLSDPRFYGQLPEPWMAAASASKRKAVRHVAG